MVRSKRLCSAGGLLGFVSMILFVHGAFSHIMLWNHLHGGSMTILFYLGRLMGPEFVAYEVATALGKGAWAVGKQVVLPLLSGISTSVGMSASRRPELALLPSHGDADSIEADNPEAPLVKTAGPLIPYFAQVLPASILENIDPTLTTRLKGSGEPSHQLALQSTQGLHTPRSFSEQHKVHRGRLAPHARIFNHEPATNGANTVSTELSTTGGQCPLELESDDGSPADDALVGADYLATESTDPDREEPAVGGSTDPGVWTGCSPVPPYFRQPKSVKPYPHRHVSIFESDILNRHQSDVRVTWRAITTRLSPLGIQGRSKGASTCDVHPEQCALTLFTGEEGGARNAGQTHVRKVNSFFNSTLLPIFPREIGLTRGYESCADRGMSTVPILDHVYSTETYGSADETVILPTEIEKSREEPTPDTNIDLSTTTSQPTSTSAWVLSSCQTLVVWAWVRRCVPIRSIRPMRNLFATLLWVIFCVQCASPWSPSQFSATSALMAIILVARRKGSTAWTLAAWVAAVPLFVVAQLLLKETTMAVERMVELESDLHEFVGDLEKGIPASMEALQPAKEPDLASRRHLASGNAGLWVAVVAGTLFLGATVYAYVLHLQRENLSADRIGLQDQVDTLRVRLQTALSQSEQRTGEVKSTNIQAQDLRCRLRKSESEEQVLLSRIERAEQAVQAAGVEIGGLTRERMELKQENARLVESLRRERSAISDRMAKLKDEIRRVETVAGKAAAGERVARDELENARRSFDKAVQSSTDSLKNVYGWILAQHAAGRLASLPPSSMLDDDLFTKAKDAQPPPAKKLTPRPAGLKNTGNDCPLNAVLQFLKATFSSGGGGGKGLNGDNEDSSSSISFTAKLADLYQTMASGTSIVYEVSEALKNLVFSSVNLIANVQADAGEVLIKVFDILSNENNSVLETFKGQRRTVCKCSCGKATERSEWFSLLTLPMQPLARGKKRRKSVALIDLFAKAFAKAKVDTCEDCRHLHGGKSVPARQESSVFLDTCPDKLLLQLGRFSGDGGAPRKKLTYLVEIPMVLDVGSFTEFGKAVGGVNVVYDVDSVIHHTAWTGQDGDVGNQKGHYFTFVRTGKDTWTRLDDSRVSTVGTDEVLTNGVYIVSYTKRLG